MNQKMRKLLIIISFFCLPITFVYFSPYIIIIDSAKGIVSGSFIVFFVVFILSLFLGRFFCGWLCPCGGAQECLMLIKLKNTKNGKRNYIKYFIWLAWICIIVYTVILAGGYHEINFFNHTENGISLILKEGAMAYPIYYGVLSLLVIVSLFAGKRSFCHYLCWMAPFMVIGTKIQQMLRIPALHIEAEKHKCISCKKCNVSCPMSLDVEEMVNKNNMINSECILCGTCKEVCPKQIFTFKYSKRNRSK